MKNHQYIRKLPVKKLAELLVEEVEVNVLDEGLDGEWEDCYETRYTMPDGRYAYDFDDAVKYTMDWLNSERKED